MDQHVEIAVVKTGGAEKFTQLVVLQAAVFPAGCVVHLHATCTSATHQQLNARTADRKTVDQRPDLQNILRQSYDYLTIIGKKSFPILVTERWARS